MTTPENLAGENLTGGCLCGAVRYAIAGRPLRSLACHCKNCQRQSGGPMMSILVVDAGALAITGTPRSYASSSSGKRHFCADCGTPLYFETAERPSIRALFAGTLDAPENFTPAAHIWTSRMAAWLKLPEGVRCFAEAP